MDSTNETTLKLQKNPLDSITDPVWRKRLSDIQTKMQFDLIGLTDLKRPLTIDFYKKWLDQGLFGDMDYLKNHFDTKAHPQNIEPNLMSALTIGHHYYPVFDKPDVHKPARIAMYAQNNDYHFWLKEKLNQTIQLLKKELKLLQRVHLCSSKINFFLIFYMNIIFFCINVGKIILK